MTPKEINLLIRNTRNVFDKNKCWLRGNDSSVYTTIIINGKPKPAHRASYEFFKKVEINPKLVACHRCDIKNCINPDHIFIGTYSDNLRDSIYKGRSKKLGWLFKNNKKPMTFCGDFGNGY